MYLLKHKNIFICFLAIVFLLLFSCSISKDEIKQGIMKKQQETFDTDSFFKEYGLKIENVSLLKTGSNTYYGIITVSLDGEKHNISITVKTDSDTYMWQMDKDSLHFLFSYKMKKMGF